MRFVDQATIWVQSGKGGPGCVSFRREKYIPRGGPDGGDGGRGGQVTLVAASQKDTLYKFHFNQHFRAENGRPGMGKNRHGRNGADLTLELPLGTQVFQADSDVLLVDLSRPGLEYVVAEGGRGGQGNARFASATHRTPRFAQPGEPGQELRLRLELKLLADVGLVGMPNAGKSTLISRLSAARPKIADYPFTTLVPNLGVVVVDRDHSFVMADIPGLIEGAGQGAGLGQRFLRHIQRCGLLLHVLDAGRVLEEGNLDSYHQILAELAFFDPGLLQKRQMVLVNKMDLTGADQVLALVREKLPDLDSLGVSAVTGQGLDELKWALWGKLPGTETEPDWEEE
ncbi:MAG: GTPase ObgE [Pseudomonadota bacterium]